MSLRKRIVFDFCLTAILVFEMLYQLTGNTLHEVVGALFFACIAAHLLFARRWLAKTAASLKAGEANVHQKRLFAVALLLAADMVVLAVSSLAISQKLWDAGFDLTFLDPANIWYPAHTVAAYGLCILVLGHLVMHWKAVADALGVAYDPSRREAIGSAVNGLAVIGGIALGIGGIMRASFQASDLVVTSSDAGSAPTVGSGYRERNAETGEYATSDTFAIASLGDDDATAEKQAESAEANSDVCPLCPRRCKLTAPRCERPYEAGLIS